MIATKKLIIILFIITTLFIKIDPLYSDNKSDNERAISVWWEWKIKNIEDRYKNILIYLNNVNKIFEIAKNTQYTTEESDYGSPIPKKAFKIVNHSLEKVTTMLPPQECKTYHELTIKILESIKNYQHQRVKLGDSVSFWEATKTDKLNQIKMESDRQSEYIKILQKINFFDNMADEMWNLRLITPEEKAEMEKLKLETDKLKKNK